MCIYVTLERQPIVKLIQNNNTSICRVYKSHEDYVSSMLCNGIFRDCHFVVCAGEVVRFYKASAKSIYM